MKNSFDKVKCASCQQFKLQPTIIPLIYVGLFLTLTSILSRYVALGLNLETRLIVTVIGASAIFLYYILLLLNKTGFDCKNCGKSYSQTEFQTLEKKQHGTVTNNNRASVLIVFAITMLSAMAFVGAYTYQKVGTSLQSTVNVEQGIPKGNPHWDRAQSLFLQIRTERDIEKVKKLDAEIVSELKAVLEEQPDNPRVWYELGNAYSWISGLDGDPEVRLAAYQKAETLEPNNFLYINAVGNQLIEMGRYNEAILELQKAVRSGPNSFTYLSLAQAYRGAKIYDLARQNYQKAIDGFSSHNDEGKWDAEILQAQQEQALLPK